MYNFDHILEEMFQTIYEIALSAANGPIKYFAMIIVNNSTAFGMAIISFVALYKILCEMNQYRRKMEASEARLKAYIKNTIMYCDKMGDDILMQIGNKIKKNKLKKLKEEISQQQTLNNVTDKIMGKLETSTQKYEEKFGANEQKNCDLYSERCTRMEKSCSAAEETTVKCLKHDIDGLRKTLSESIDEIRRKIDHCTSTQEIAIKNAEEKVEKLSSSITDNGGFVLLGFKILSNGVFSPIYTNDSNGQFFVELGVDRVFLILDNYVLLCNEPNIRLEFLLCGANGYRCPCISVILHGQTIFKSETGSSVIDYFSNLQNSCSSLKEIEITKYAGHEKYMPILEYIRSVGKTQTFNGKPIVW